MIILSDFNNRTLQTLPLTLVSVAADVEEDALLSLLSFSHALSLSFSLQLSSLSLTLVTLVLTSTATDSLVVDWDGGVTYKWKLCLKELL